MADPTPDRIIQRPLVPGRAGARPARRAGADRRRTRPALLLPDRRRRPGQHRRDHRGGRRPACGARRPGPGGAGGHAACQRRVPLGALPRARRPRPRRDLGQHRRHLPLRRRPLGAAAHQLPAPPQRHADPARLRRHPGSGGRGAGGARGLRLRGCRRRGGALCLGHAELRRMGRAPPGPGGECPAGAADRAHRRCPADAAAAPGRAAARGTAGARPHPGHRRPGLRPHPGGAWRRGAAHQCRAPAFLRRARGRYRPRQAQRHARPAQPRRARRAAGAGGAGGCLPPGLPPRRHRRPRLLPGRAGGAAPRHRLHLALGLWRGRALGRPARLRFPGADRQRLQPCRGGRRRRRSRHGRAEGAALPGARPCLRLPARLRHPRGAAAPGGGRRLLAGPRLARRHRPLAARARPAAGRLRRLGADDGRARRPCWRPPTAASAG